MGRASNQLAPIELARAAVEAYIRHNKRIEPPADVSGVLSERAGVFVTLRTLAGDLRGCIGTVEPSQPNVAAEIIQNAITSATLDPRFTPVLEKELDRIVYSVDVLQPAELVSGPQDLDPALYGVMIESLDGLRRGLLLPRIEGLDTVEQQWLAVHHKAGIKLGTPVRVERFTVTRFGSD
jgi:AmmeMemoRadiSam system protein A